MPRISINGELWNYKIEVGSVNCCASISLYDMMVWYGTTSTVRFNEKHPTLEVLATLFEHWWTDRQEGNRLPPSEYKAQVMFVSPLDYRAPAGNKGENSITYTQSLIQWLIDVKKQFIITSPVFANSNYPKDGASLIQMAFWFPDFLVKSSRILPDSAGVYNEPTDDQYMTAVKTLNPKSDLFSENFMPDKNLVESRLAKAKLAWEKGRGYVDGLPPIREKKVLKWGTN